MAIAIWVTVFELNDMINESSMTLSMVTAGANSEKKLNLYMDLNGKIF